MINKKVFFLCVFVLGIVLSLIFFGETGFSTNSSILMEIRIPKIIAAFFSGGLLALAGLLMQIYFQNPIAGPDVLGVSSGSILFVALWSLGSFRLSPLLQNIGINVVSFLGALLVFSILIIFMHRQKSKMTILVIGILISSFVSSVVSVLINSSTALQVKSYLLWSQGSFRNLTVEEIPFFVASSLICFIPLIIFNKEFELISLGENYAQSIGVEVKKIKYIFVVVAAYVVSITTIYCGPIGFVGIVSPFLGKRIIRNSSFKKLLLPVFLIGTLFGLISELILTTFSFLPLTTNSILGMIGAPILFYFLYEKSERSI